MTVDHFIYFLLLYIKQTNDLTLKHFREKDKNKWNTNIYFELFNNKHP